MPEPIDSQDFAGPRPTCREFVAQLVAWEFTQRADDHVHTGHGRPDRADDGGRGEGTRLRAWLGCLKLFTSA
jgi:hypothetical protein